MRELAYEIVFGTLEKEKHSDYLLHTIQEREKTLTVHQKSYLKRLAYGTIERAVELDAVLNQFSTTRVCRMDAAVRTVLRMALYEIRYMEQVPDAAACNEAVELVRKKGAGKYAGFVNGVLRNIVRQRDKIQLKESWIALSLPEPLLRHLISQYGKKTAEKIGRAFLEKENVLTIHVDTNRIPFEEYISLLQENNISFRHGHYMEHVLLLSGVSDVRTLPGFSEGFFFVQDESSMLPAVCAGICPGNTVIDVCAAPGGKTLHALHMLNGDGYVSARDVSSKKVNLLRENIQRMQYKNVESKVWDGVKPDDEWRERADVLLADVPCSGIGIIGKKPEIKYHALEQAERLVPLQRKICEASVTMLKPGGVFIYSTCTINHAENEENAAWLEEHLGLRRDSIDKFLPAALRNRMTEQGMLQMLPGVQKTDGFFVARFIKA